MKKLLLFITCLLFISCIGNFPTKLYYIEYEVHYPDRIDTLSAVKEFYKFPKVESYSGTNYIHYTTTIDDETQRDETLVATTSPIKIITIKEQ